MQNQVIKLPIRNRQWALERQALSRRQKSMKLLFWAIIISWILVLPTMGMAYPKGYHKPKPAPIQDSAADPSASLAAPVVSAPASTATPSNLDVCFSPNEGCDQKLIALIASASGKLDIAVYSITHPGIVNTIIAAQQGGRVQVRMVVDKTQAKGTGSLVNSLVAAGVPLKIGDFKGIMHDKFTIVDSQIMETGSYNYTNNATNNNAENQLYLSDANVISRYQSNFEEMWGNGLAP